MFFKGRLSIKQEVFYTGMIFSIITLLVFGIMFSNYLGRIAVERARSGIMENNKQIGIFTEGLFTEVTNTIEALAKNTDIVKAGSGDEISRERALAIYRDFYKANENIAYIYSGYEDGSLLINDYTPPPGFDSTKRPWYIAAMKNRPEQSVGLPYQEAVTNEWLISQSKALIDERGEYIGAIAIDLSLAEILVMMHKDYLYTTQTSFIMDQSGEIIIHPHEDMLGTTVPEIQQAITGSQGDITYKENGTVLWAHYSTINSTGWIILTAVDRSEVLGPIIGRIALYTTVVLLLAIALGVLQYKIIGKRFAEPLIALGQRVAAITAGKSTDSITYQHSNYEIATIARNIEQLAERSLEKKAYELKTILESTQDGILVVDENRQVVYVNSSFKELWNLDEDTSELLDERGLIELITEQLLDPAAFQEKTEALYASYRIDNDTLTCKDGRVFERYTRPLVGEGQLLGRLWSFRDITEKKRVEERLKAMATIDELTGLWNRRHFFQLARHELERARRYAQPFSFMILDLDYFKKVNDTLGHAAGDATLQHIAALLTKTLRDVDISGRVGGEEFGILMPNTELQDGVMVAERLRKVIENTPPRYEGKKIHCTVSFGVTAYEKGTTSLDELYKTADKALYEAKESGRNRTVQKKCGGDN